MLKKNGEINEEYPPVSKGWYSKQYATWLDFFPKEQILVIHGEAFVKDPYPILKTAETFLGLRPFIRREHIVWVEKKGFYCPAVGNKAYCLPAGKGRKHPFVNNETIDKLRDYYRPYNRKFEEMVNYRFQWP